MGIQINGQTDTISASDGSLVVSGAELPTVGNINATGIITATSFVGNVTGNINATGVSTLGNTIVGGATTELVVNGDARITGILTVGTASITFDGTNNSVTIGTGVTVFGNTGIVSATEFRGSGASLTGVEANGALRSVQYYTSSGSATWTKPTGLKRVRVYVTGGGGGGRGNISNGGTGGAGGGTAIKVIEAASLGSTETVTVGAAGAAGNSTSSGVNAGDGGTSSFGSHCSATGGSGGDVGGGGRYIRGGSGSGGDLNLKGGGVVCSSTAISQAGTPGGDSFWSGGGGSGKNDITYTQSYVGNSGSGGGGATGGSYVGAGSNGGTGVVVVEEYF